MVTKMADDGVAHVAKTTSATLQPNVRFPLAEYNFMVPAPAFWIQMDTLPL
jgi:hypothetical protein